MPRPMKNPPSLVLPPQPDLSQWPVRTTAPNLSKIISRYLFEVSAREIRERWPLEWVIIGDRGHAETAVAWKLAERRLAAARVVRVGVREKSREEGTEQVAA